MCDDVPSPLFRFNHFVCNFALSFVAAARACTLRSLQGGGGGAGWGATVTSECATISVLQASVAFPPKRLTGTGWWRLGPSAKPAWEVFTQLSPPPRTSYSASQLALPLAAVVLLWRPVER